MILVSLAKRLPYGVSWYDFIELLLLTFHSFSFSISVDASAASYSIVPASRIRHFCLCSNAMILINVTTS